MLHKWPLLYEWGCVPGEEKNEVLRGREISDAGWPNVSNSSKNFYINERTDAFKTQIHLRNKNKSGTEETVIEVILSESFHEQSGLYWLS